MLYEWAVSKPSPVRPEARSTIRHFDLHFLHFVSFPYPSTISPLPTTDAFSIPHSTMTTQYRGQRSGVVQHLVMPRQYAPRVLQYAVCVCPPPTPPLCRSISRFFFLLLSISQNEVCQVKSSCLSFLQLSPKMLLPSFFLKACTNHQHTPRSPFLDSPSPACVITRIIVRVIDDRMASSHRTQ